MRGGKQANRCTLPFWMLVFYKCAISARHCLWPKTLDLRTRIHVPMIPKLRNSQTDSPSRKEPGTRREVNKI